MIGRHGREAEAPMWRQWSERELTTKLKHSRIVGGCNLAECRIVGARVDTLELRVIKGIEAFNTDLQSQVFCECKRLERCQIEVEESGKDDRIPSRVAKALIRSSCPRGDWGRKGILVEPGEASLWIRDFTHDVRTIGCISTQTGDVGTVIGERLRIARLHLGHSRDLPAS